MKLKKLSIASLQTLNDPHVFVINKTTGHEKGQVLITVSKINGQGNDTVIVPNTFIPVPLSEQVSKTQLLASSDFRSAVNRGSLQIVDTDGAEKILETRAAQRELARIRKQQESFRQNVVDLDEVYADIEDTTKGMRDMIGELEGGEKTLEDYVQAPVLQLVVDLEESGDEDSAISTLRNIEKVSTKDLRYIYKNVNKKHKEIISYAKTEHDELKKARKAKKRSK